MDNNKLISLYDKLIKETESSRANWKRQGENSYLLILTGGHIILEALEHDFQLIAVPDGAEPVTLLPDEKHDAFDENCLEQLKKLYKLICGLPSNVDRFIDNYLRQS